MGTEVKRVHIDFDWYEGKNHTRVWPGYLLDEITCPLCNGIGINASGKVCPLCYGEEEVWPKIEPAKGYDFENTNGYQIWENVSDGSPISPVFLKPEDLAKWMVENDDSITKDTTYEGWLKFIKKEGSAFTMVLNNGQIKSGVAALYNPEEEKVISRDKKQEVKRENLMKLELPKILPCPFCGNPVELKIVTTRFFDGCIKMHIHCSCNAKPQSSCCCTLRSPIPLATMLEAVNDLIEKWYLNEMEDKVEQ